MKGLCSIAALAILSTASIASAQVTTPTPGQPGAQVAPGMPNSSDKDPNNPAASRDAEKSPMGTPRTGTTGAGSSSPNNLTGPATTPAEKSPQRNDPTPAKKDIQ
jgi:hypothetical protein